MLHDVDVWVAPGLRGAISWAPTPPSIGHLIATVVWVRAVLIPEGGGHKSQTEERIISPEHEGGWDRGRGIWNLSPKDLKGQKKMCLWEVREKEMTKVISTSEGRQRNCCHLTSLASCAFAGG